ncbi:MAG: iron-sulfur cluster carrier protein MrpORP [Candidatus Alcyoniella australis]|nr:iron-sulfur cluster carrier protein MrpORP [Candidatus Alcyoniella australis]
MQDNQQQSDRKAQMQAQTERITETLAKVKNKILVMSGKGGVGKSTVAANLAVGLAKRGYQVGLLDIDLHGPTVPGLLGLVDEHPQTSPEGITPLQFLPNLKVLSMGNLLKSKDDAVIWRGPLKIGVIRQFVADSQWGDLDYLLIDSPPGTGDEPLTVAQDFTGVKALVVTTPQEVSLADVRKSLTFCRSVNMPVLGLIENMGSYVCPHCGHSEALFGSGGGKRTAEAAKVPFLGGIPLDPRVVVSGDAGKPLMLQQDGWPVQAAYNEILEKIVAASSGNEQQPAESKPSQQPQTAEPQGSSAVTNIAIPTAEGTMCAHFGHCEVFTLVSVQNNEIIDTKQLPPPPHEPGVLPRWLSEQGANIIIAGGMGSRAQQFFTDFGIEVRVGAQPGSTPEELVRQYIAGTLATGDNICDH